MGDTRHPRGDMLRRHRGVIADIASVAGYRGLAGAQAYGATKAAQINLLESLRISRRQERGAHDDHLPGLRAH
jgi:NAD(P)-dependent dehydrogenase (short-subunit alcohol dehydrogenase family)